MFGGQINQIMNEEMTLEASPIVIRRISHLISSFMTHFEIVLVRRRARSLQRGRKSFMFVQFKTKM